MTTEELLQELKNKLERLQELEAAAESFISATTPNTQTGIKEVKPRKKRGEMTQETKDKIAAGRKAAWAEKKKAKAKESAA
jgi:uncharacterized protein YbaP (TraB family)